MRTLVVFAHPDPAGFGRAVCDSAVAGLEAAGHSVDVIDLYSAQFSAAMTEAERRAYHSDAPILDPMVQRSADLVSSAEAIVFVYPTWWWGLPAVLKGWFDRVLVPGVAFTLGDGPPQPALTTVRRLVGVTTYGSSRRYMRLFTDSGRRTIGRTLRLVCHRRARVWWLGMYGVDASSFEERAAFLEKVEDKMASL